MTSPFLKEIEKLNRYQNELSEEIGAEFTRLIAQAFKTHKIKPRKVEFVEGMGVMWIDISCRKKADCFFHLSPHDEVEIHGSYTDCEFHLKSPFLAELQEIIDTYWDFEDELHNVHSQVINIS
jgi:hypothetical protein